MAFQREDHWVLRKAPEEDPISFADTVESVAGRTGLKLMKKTPEFVSCRMRLAGGGSGGGGDEPPDAL